MQSQLDKIKQEFIKGLNEIKDTLQLTELENRFFSRRSGEMNEVLKNLKDLSVEAKKEFGQLANEVKNELTGLMEKKRREMMQKEMTDLAVKEKIDITQPKLPKHKSGHLHPNTIVQNELEDLFASMGFMVLDGPELESDYYNFTAVNIPESHPARDMQDTFYIKESPVFTPPSSASGRTTDGRSTAGKLVMRTHTSSVQVRAMQKYGAPIRAIAPGKCFRNEATDARHEHTFYQLEGFVIDKNISFADMKGVLETVVKKMFGQNTELRLRPKYYPFVEPGVNGEVTCFFCVGKGCRVCKNTGWLEILGAGMIHPNVLKEGEIDSNVYQGFAFGFGLTRLVMLKYGIDDVRLLMGGDLRLIKQI